jgi:hypothetical protein
VEERARTCRQASHSLPAAVGLTRPGVRPPLHPPASVDYSSRPAEQRGTSRRREAECEQRDTESRQRDWQTLRRGKPEGQEMRGQTERGELR